MLTRVMVVDRAQGKTTKALRWLMEGHATSMPPGWSRILIEPHLSICKEVRNRARDMGWSIKQAEVCIIPVERLPMLKGLYDVEFAFDNAELLLPATPGPVTFMTINGLATF